MNGSDVDQLDQFQRLVMVAGALTGDIEPEQVVEIVASQAMAGTHASGAGLYLLDGDIVHLATAVGSTRASIRPVIGRGVGRLDTPLPGCAAIKRREALWFASREQGIAEYPQMAGSSTRTRGWAFVPLLNADEPFGSLSLSFDAPPRFDPADRQFIVALADLAALALLDGSGRPWGRRQRTRARIEPLVEVVVAVSALPTDGVLVVDDTGCIVSVNDRAAALLGYRQHELTDRFFEVLLPEDLRSAHVRHRARYLADPVPRPFGSGLALVARRAGGEPLAVDVALSPCTTSHGVYVVAVIRERAQVPAVPESSEVAQGPPYRGPVLDELVGPVSLPASSGPDAGVQR